MDQVESPTRRTLIVVTGQLYDLILEVLSWIDQQESLLLYGRQVRHKVDHLRDCILSELLQGHEFGQQYLYALSGASCISAFSSDATRIIQDGIDLATILVELSDRDRNWFEVRHLEVVDYAVFLAKKQDFWSDNAKIVCDLAPSFVVNKFDWKRILTNLVETVVQHIITGVLIHGTFEFFAPDLL